MDAASFALTGKAVLALGLMGLVSAGLLAIAARQFHVDVDPRIQAVLDALPGANCGACGHPSCFNVAEGIAAGELPTKTCVAGGQSVAHAVAEVMGVEKAEVLTVVSCRHCGGGINAQRSFDYSGVMSCAAASKLAGGPLTCPGGCFGFGDCMEACPFDAIRMDARGLPVIDLAKCTGCGICVRECPRGQTGLLELVPENAPVLVRCSSGDKGAAKRKYCTMSCIACKKCEKECPTQAIVVEGNLAVVDFERCIACGICVDVCPQNCIDLSGRENGRPVGATDGKGKEVAGFAPDREKEPQAATSD